MNMTINSRVALVTVLAFMYATLIVLTIVWSYWFVFPAAISALTIWYLIPSGFTSA
jgi:hypothetical protein